MPNYKNTVEFKDFTMKQFFSQFILFEGDDYIIGHKAEIMAYVKAVIASGQKNLDNFVIRIGEEKIAQKLENSPFALLALVPPCDKRTYMIEESLKSSDNCVALLKWLGHFGTHMSLTVKDRRVIENAFDYVDWNPNIPQACWDGNIESSIKAIQGILAVRKAEAEKTERENEWTRVKRPEAKLIADIKSMELGEILKNMDTCIHIGFDPLTKIMSQKANKGEFLLPIQWVEAFCLIEDIRSPLIGRKGDDPTCRKWSAFISDLMENQYKSLRKMRGTALLVIDMSGSMCESVKFNEHYAIDRIDIAVSTALTFQALCENCIVYLTAENGKTTIRKVELPFDLYGASEHVRKEAERMGSGGINTHFCLQMIKNELDAAGTKPDMCFVFSDSGDGCYGSHRVFPQQPPVRVAPIMVLTDAAHTGRSKVQIDAQWEMEVLGFSNYMTEAAFDLAGVTNPTAKSSDFNGGSYRVSF
jgi:hypothetical protein